MLETRATIIEIKADHAIVAANQVSGCEQCDGKGCGSSKVAQMFCNKPRQFEVDNPIGAKLGDDVIISVADGAVLRGISLLYLMPIAFLVLGGGLASMFASSTQGSDVYVACGGGIGLLLGFVAARWVSMWQSRLQNRPFIARQWVEVSK